MKPKLLALYGLKWNPFSPEVPTEALLTSARLDQFFWRIENLTREGGFALVTGEPGLGKSVALRLLVQRLANQRDLMVGVLTRPQTGVPDLYRELGHLFGVELSPHNRWADQRQSKLPSCCLIRGCYPSLAVNGSCHWLLFWIPTLGVEQLSMRGKLRASDVPTIPPNALVPPGDVSRSFASASVHPR